MRSQVAKKVKNAKAPRVFLKATDREPARRNLLGEIYSHGNSLGSACILRRPDVRPGGNLPDSHAHTRALSLH